METREQILLKKYYDTTLFRYKDKLSPMIRVTDSNGNPIEGATVTLTLASSYWSEESGNQIQKFYSSPTGSDVIQFLLRILLPL